MDWRRQDLESEKHIRKFYNSPVEKTSVYIRAGILRIVKKCDYKIYYRGTIMGLAIVLDDLCVNIGRQRRLKF